MLIAIECMAYICLSQYPLLRSDIILCFYKINNKENTRLISESRILHLHKIMYSAEIIDL